MAALWAAIRLPNLALDAVRRQRNDLAELLALVGGRPGREVVTAVSDAAVDLGVSVGQKRVAAEMICPGLQVVQQTDDLMTRAIAQLAAWAYGYTSQVCVDWPGALVLEVGRSLSLHGGWPALERRLRSDLVDLGYRYRLAVAPTIRGALMLAQSSSRSPFVADRQQLRRALSPLSIVDLPGHGDAGPRLAAMGVKSVGSLLRLESASLRRRFGPGLTGELAMLLGQAPEVPALYIPPRHFEANADLGFDVTELQALLFPLRRLVTDLSIHLASNDAGVQEFEIELGDGAGDQSTRTARLSAAERQAHVLFEAARTALERTPPSHPVAYVRIFASNLYGFIPEGRDLFDSRPANAMSWPQLRDRLCGRIGSEAVYHVEEYPDPRPEHAWRRGNGNVRNAPAVQEQPRPAWLLPSPEPLRSSVSEVVAGPERIETGWWDGGLVRRDYYVIRIIDGRVAWAFTEAGQDGPWHVHGWF